MAGMCHLSGRGHCPVIVQDKAYDVPRTSLGAEESEISLSPHVSRISATALSLSIVLLVAASVPVSALERTDGDYWVYSMQLVVPGLDVAADGTLKYEFISQDTVNVGETDVPVNVMRVTGAAAGSVDIIDLGASLVIEGYVYEGLDNMSTVKSDLTYWINLTWGSGDFSWPINSAIRTASTYTPPLLSEFDPVATAPGSTWTETSLIRTVTYNVTTGAVESEETEQATTTYTASTEFDTISTGVGRFEALRITAAEEDGGRIIYWWSADLGLFVKEQTYVDDSSQPVQTLLLEQYSGGSGSSVLVFLVIGGVATAIALVALAAVLVKRRPPRSQADETPPLELLPPPP